MLSFNFLIHNIGFVIHCELPSLHSCFVNRKVLNTLEDIMWISISIAVPNT